MRRWNHFGKVLIAVILGSALTNPAATGADPAPDRFLRVRGQEVRQEHGKGEVVTLRGVNLGGWLVFEDWMCPMDASGLKDDAGVRATLTRRFGAGVRDELLAGYQDTYITTADLDNIAALGMNVVRVPFWYPTFLENESTWRGEGFAKLDWVVDQAWRRGIYTILDFHGVPGGQSESESTGKLRKPETGLSPEFWGNHAFQERTIEVWRRVAEHYRGNPAVAAYDLINEPSAAPSRAQLWSVYDAMIRAIRAGDPDHIITVEGCWSGQVDGKFIPWGWDVLPPPEQAGWTNVVYQVHHYEYDWNNLAKQIATADAQVESKRRHARWNVPCWMGEFNVMAQEKAWDHAVRAYSAAGIGWMVWSYKAIHGSGDDSWGVYNPRKPFPAKPDIEHDSADLIRQNWSRWSTADAFTINPMLQRVLAMPVPIAESYATRPGQTLSVDAPGILANDTHLNLGQPGVRLTAREGTDPKLGALTLRDDGSFTYQARPGATGTDTFTYRVFDGRLDSARTGTVTITLRP